MKDISIIIEENKKFNYRVGILIQCKDEVYVEFNPDFDFSTLPGGRVKILESSKEALFREIKEEANVEIDLNKIEMKAIIENLFQFEERKYHEIYILYKLVVDNKDQFKEGMKNIDSKKSYYRWINKNKLNEVRLLPDKIADIIDSDKIENIIIDELK